MDLLHARSRLSAGSVTEPALVAEYLVGRARHHRGTRALQGTWQPPLDVEGVPAELMHLTRERLWKLDQHATRSLLAWGAGRRKVRLLFHVPSALDVLDEQARGSRFICLVDDAQVLPPHENGYLFVVHDLCHLEKFADPEHHHAQVGFFRAVRTLLQHPSWRAFESTLDMTWIAHRDAVVSDMNGSVIFLMAALKMKLKMAVRRKLAREQGRPAPTEGPLSDEELRAYEPVLDGLLAWMGLPPDVADAARAISKRRDTPLDALLLHHHLDRVGR